MDKKLTVEDIVAAIEKGNLTIAQKIAEQVDPLQKGMAEAMESMKKLAEKQNKLLDKNFHNDENKFQSFGEQLVSIAKSSKSGVVSPKLKAVHNLDDAHLGSFLIQEEFANELTGGMFETGVLAKRVTTIETANNMLNINSMKETSRASGSRLGGLRAYWEAEYDTATATNTAFKRQTLTLDKLMGAYQATDEVLEDAPFLESYIKKLFIEEFGFQLDLAILKGTGSGAPLGILNSNALLTQTKTGDITGTNYNVTINELYNMDNKVLNRSTAVWLANRSEFPGLRSLKLGESGVYAFTGAGIQGITTDQLIGKEVIEVEQLPVIAANSGSLMLVNLDEYTLFKKAGNIKMASSIHVDFLKELNTFRFSMRITGRPNYDSYVTMFDGSTTVSPYVVTA